MSWFYPEDKPPIYAYTSAFTSSERFESASGRHYYLHGEDAIDTVMEQKNIAGGAMSDDAKTGAAIEELNRMMNMAREGERAFLMAHNFKDPGGDWNKLITNINLILGTEASFRRNVAILKQVNSGDRKMYEDVSAYFKDKLQASIYESIVVDVNASGYDILERAVKSAIDKMANITDTIDKEGNIKGKRPNKNEQAFKAFSELFGIIKLIINCDILQQISELFALEQYIEDVRSDILKGNTTTKRKLTYKGTGNKGTIAEILYNIVVQGLGGGSGANNITWQVAEHTGSANYKPDRYLATIDVSYNESVQTIKDNDIDYGRSVRARGIDVMEDLYKKVGDAKGDIIFISDKNYIINQAFKDKGGFTAQDNVSLNALSSLFAKFQIQVIDIEALINYLANVGSNMIETTADQHILDMIATQIGNFLFDDLHFESFPTGANIVHVFQLSGVYVPLSIVLEGTWQGLMGLMGTNLSSYVSVTFKASSGNPRQWKRTETPWVNFRNQKEERNKLSVKFLANFAQVIANSVHI